MNLLLRWIILFGSVVLITSCKSKKKPSLSGDEPVEVKDFIEFFQTVSLPYHFEDSLLLRKENDSIRISAAVFHQFVPDSVISSVLGMPRDLKIYPLGKVVESRERTYLFTKVLSAGKRAAFILVFDKRDSFMTALPVLRPQQNKAVHTSTIIDRKYTITSTQLRKNIDGSTSEGKEIFALNPESREFMLIMTDPLDDKLTELINPIDTFQRKHKYAADYGTGKMNIVSIRDGSKNDRLYFFIHFEKNKGACVGELKGEAFLRTATMAEYREGGDPCVLQFRFTNSSVTLKELEGCGAHRGVRCSFDGFFARKREAKPKVVKKK
jgi:hypothetical protein